MIYGSYVCIYVNWGDKGKFPMSNDEDGKFANLSLPMVHVKQHLGPVCFVGIEFHFDNYNLDKTN
jgi:hypothetical protein